MSGPDAMAGWLPFFVTAHDGQRQVEWGYMGRERFTEPFFLETLQILLRRPFNQAFRRQSGLDLLLARAQSHPGLPLKGIVFHMSRCGSTLAAQWLAALPDSVVLSEPEPLDTLLQWPAPFSDKETVQALLSALGQPRRESDRGLFLKTDCWHMAHIDRLLTAFPRTPWVFLYRDPVEVLVSHQRMPGWHMVPGSMAVHGLHPPAELWNNPLGNGAWILSAMLKQAGQAMERHDNGLLLNYSELPEALETKLAAHFGMELTTSTIETLRPITRRHSKRNQAVFLVDTDEKRAAADSVILELTERWLNEPYQALEQLRRAQSMV
jgi:hypothetical protein